MGLFDAQADAAIDDWVNGITPALNDAQKDAVRGSMHPLARALYDRMPGRIVQRTQVNLATSVATAAGVWVDVISASFTCVAGDVLDIEAIAFAQSAGGSVCNVRVVVVDGGLTYTTGTVGSLPAGANYIQTNALRHLWTVFASGTVTVKLQAIGNGGSTITVYGTSAGIDVVSRLVTAQQRF